jgi:S-adenosylmethionine hydrolase
VGRRVVALLTDFGAGSEHVGALHAVVAAACPGADRIDLAHDLPAGDVRAGALSLARLAALLPGAVHVAVVDPGVGTDRRAAAVALAGGGALVGPDNGLLGPAAAALGAVAAVALVPPPGAAATFHGRDLFAPAAARLAAGEPLAALGEPFDPATLVAPDLPPPRVEPGRLSAEVVGVDRYGNVQLLAGAEHLAAAGFGRGERI